jgi:hypothetical protein
MRVFFRCLKWALIILLLAVAAFAVTEGPNIYRAAYPSRDYDSVPPAVPAKFPRPAVLVFSKTNGFRHGDAIDAANAMFRDLAKSKGWSVYSTENGAVFTPELLSRFQVVVFNNASGAPLDDKQRAALRAWIEQGGGFVAIHAAGDNSHEDWAWYSDELIGARFILHTIWPHAPRATIHVEAADHPVMAGLPAVWIRSDEWYSFYRSVRGVEGFRVLATLDESTYERGGPMSGNLAMGKDHPIIWSNCLAKGRVLYSALGHFGETFAEPHVRTMMGNAVNWSMERGPCDPAGDSKASAQSPINTPKNPE